MLMEIITSVRRLYISFKSLVNDFVYSFGRAALLLLVEVQNHTVPVRERGRIRANVLAKGPLGDLVGCDGTIANVSQRVRGVKEFSGCSCLRIAPSGMLCEHSNEFLSAVKYGNILTSSVTVSFAGPARQVSVFAQLIQLTLSTTSQYYAKNYYFQIPTFYPAAIQRKVGNSCVIERGKLGL